MSLSGETHFKNVVRIKATGGGAYKYADIFQVIVYEVSDLPIWWVTSLQTNVTDRLTLGKRRGHLK